MRPFPSGVQIGVFCPPARGGALSPITKPGTSKSKFAVRLRGFAFGKRSRTQRSGCVYELIGRVVDAVNATCFPSGLSDSAPPPGPKPPTCKSIVVIFTPAEAGPAAATRSEEHTSELQSP